MIMTMWSILLIGLVSRPILIRSFERASDGRADAEPNVPFPWHADSRTSAATEAIALICLHVFGVNPKILPPERKHPPPRIGYRRFVSLAPRDISASPFTSLFQPLHRAQRRKEAHPEQGDRNAGDSAEQRGRNGTEKSRDRSALK